MTCKILVDFESCLNYVKRWVATVKLYEFSSGKSIGSFDKRNVKRREKEE